MSDMFKFLEFCDCDARGTDGPKDLHIERLEEYIYLVHPSQLFRHLLIVPFRLFVRNNFVIRKSLGKESVGTRLLTVLQMFCRINY